MSENNKLYFASDYQEGAHPAIMQALMDTNMVPTTGYGKDEICDDAKAKIKEACKAPGAQVEFLVGGTQTNAIVISALLSSYQGVLSADGGHIAVHEAGAIELTGHKVLTLPSAMGKITATQVEQYMADYEADDNHEHIVMPGMVYISQPTEYGTLYSKAELEALSKVCKAHNIPLYVDGARLAYALGCPENDVTLEDLAELTDVFYIGGTKCGALFGEAVVVPNPELIPHFFTIIKQRLALLAKGRLHGVQFGTLFTDDLYFKLGQSAVTFAGQIKKTLIESGYRIYIDSPTNQVFFVIENSKLEKLSEKAVYAFGEKYDDDHSVIRFCTSWASTQENVDKLCEVIKAL